VSIPVQQLPGQTQFHERRAHPRVLPRTLIYVACGQSNGGMVLNASDDGLAISMAIPVGDEAYSKLQVRMNGLPQPVEVYGRMAWTTQSKKRAGIQLVDVSEEQRGKIREWLAQDGVRDVNLLPRISEPSASALPAFAAAAIAPKSPEEQRPEPSPAVASVGSIPAVLRSIATNPLVLSEPHASLLAGLRGTEPEFLALAEDDPADQPSFTEDTVSETKPSQNTDSVFPRFRGNEWDLASITMVPRRRSKPEGLSALGLLLLWIAIPSFGIGLIVGRRPLEQWLSRAIARKSISPTPEPEVVTASNESPDTSSADMEATSPQSIPTRTVETPATTSSKNLKTPAATKSFVSTPPFVDTGLLNSVSTQERRALKPPVSPASPENANTRQVSNLDSSTNSNSATKDTPSAVTTLKPALGSHTASTVTATPVHAPENSTAHQHAAGSTGSIQAVGNVPASSSQSPRHSASSTVGTSGNSAATSASNGDAVLTASKTQPSVSSSTSSAKPYDAAPVKSDSRIASDTTPRVAPNVNPSVGAAAAVDTATRVATGTYGSSSSRSAAPSAPANVAPVNAQSPLHGVMLVARKNNESFLLKLPVESVPGGRALSVEIQRFVMVPPESRWHHHGPIAKLAVGELLTQVTTLETASAARPGDAITVRVYVDKNGSVQDLKPVSGRFALMPRVMHDLREWQFDQTLIDGKPVESEINVTVEFRSGPQPPASRGRQIQAQNSFRP
jgi:hypothetical protein